MQRLIYILLVGVALSLVGCGSSNTSATAGSPAAPNVYNGFVLGRVMLDRPMNQGRVRVVDLQGNLIREVPTTHAGFFQFRGQLPADFSVLATPAGSSDTYRLEVRGGWRGGTLYVNAGTTLAAAHAAAHPELSYQQALLKVRRYLKLPPTYALAWISTVKSKTFDPQAFYRQVAAAGLQAHLTRLVQEIDTPPALLGLADAAASLAGQVGSTLFSDVINASIGGAAGAGLNKMGFNFGTSATLDEIIDLLNQVQTELTNLSNALGQDAAYGQLTSAQNAAQPYAANISLQTATLSQTANSFKSTHPDDSYYNQPESVPSEVTNAISSFRSFNLQFSIQEVADYLLGTGGAPSSVVNAYIAYQMSNLDSTSSSSSYHGYPMRSNPLTAGQATLAGYYLNTLVQGINLVSETARLAVPPATALANAIQDVTKIQGQILQASWLVSDPLPADELLVDLEAGVMWYTVFQPNASYADAQSFADNLVIGPYSGWELACEDRLENLVTNRLLPILGLTGQSSWDDGYNWKGAFATLGFDTTDYGHVENSPTGSQNDNEGSWFDSSTNTDFGSTNCYEWNNTNKNPSTDSYATTGVTCSYIVVRQYPGGAETNAVTTYDGEATNITQAEIDNLAAEGSIFPSPFATGIFNGSLSLKQDGSNPNQLRAYQGFKAEVVSPSSCPNSSSGNFNNGQAYEVTPRCLYVSSNPTVASVSSFPPVNSTIISADAPPPGPSGRVTWHPSLSGATLPSVTINATLGGMTSSTSFGNQTASLTLNPPAGLQPQFKSLQVLPLNQKFDLVSTQNLTVPFYATAYYADGQFVDVSQDANITWVAVGQDGTVLNNTKIGGFGVLSGSNKNDLWLTGNITTSNISVLGIYSGPWGGGTTAVNHTLVLDIPSPSPTPTPALTGISVLPPNATYLGLPVNYVFNAITRYSDGSQRLTTSLMKWVVYSVDNGAELPATQGTYPSITNIGATLRLNTLFPGNGVYVGAELNGRVGTGNLTLKGAVVP